MSYDLMVFDPQAPPPNHDGFIAWYFQQTEWEEEHGYDNPGVSTPALRAWFFEMIEQFPAMNGPYAQTDVNDPRVADYCVGQSVIYVAFAWSQANTARQTMLTFAEKHQVGFFDVSADDTGEVWVPGPNGKYTCIYGGVGTQP